MNSVTLIICLKNISTKRDIPPTVCHCGISFQSVSQVWFKSFYYTSQDYSILYLPRYPYNKQQWKADFCFWVTLK